MNVFAVRGEGPYCAGMVIVAALDTEQAKQIACATHNDWWIDYRNPEMVEPLDCTAEGPARELTRFEYRE